MAQLHSKKEGNLP